MAATRKFNGRMFKLVAGPHTKKRTNALAKSFRKKGALARIVPYEKGYLLYIAYKY